VAMVEILLHHSKAANMPPLRVYEDYEPHEKAMLDIDPDLMMSGPSQPGPGKDKIVVFAHFVQNLSRICPVRVHFTSILTFRFHYYLGS
jgi:hypothetical protein